MGRGHQYQPGLRGAGKSGVSSRAVRVWTWCPEKLRPRSRSEKGERAAASHGVLPGLWPHAGEQRSYSPGLSPALAGRSLRVCPLSLCPRPGAAAEAPLLPREVAAEGHQTRLAIPAASGLGTARETLGITPGLGGSAQPPGKTRVLRHRGGASSALRATALRQPRTDTWTWHGIWSPPACIFPQPLHLQSRHNLFGRYIKSRISTHYGSRNRGCRGWW